MQQSAIIGLLGITKEEFDQMTDSDTFRGLHDPPETSIYANYTLLERLLDYFNARYATIEYINKKEGIVDPYDDYYFAPGAYCKEFDVMCLRVYLN